MQKYGMALTKNQQLYIKVHEKYHYIKSHQCALYVQKHTSPSNAQQ